MELIHPIVEKYVEQFSSPHNALLQQILDDTYNKHSHAHMVSGSVQGIFLKMVSQMIRPLKVLEIGTFTGFSALCLAEGLQKEGMLHTIEIREADAQTAQQYFDKSNYVNQIKLHLGNALEIIPSLSEIWDIVFIDADKINYINYYELVLPQVKQGGFLLVDNVLFHGQVLQEAIEGKNAKAIHEFNNHIKNDKRVEQVMLSIRDGINLIRKNSMKKFTLIIGIAFLFLKVSAQKNTPQDYINLYKNIAIEEMQQFGIPASITLAQGLLESEMGNSDLVKKSNNHFGIKCKTGWQGEFVTHTDDATNECFRKYKSAWDSYKDHSTFLKNSPRYASLFSIGTSDYKAWAFGLKKAGYATNPRYPQILIDNIEKYNLQQYDTTSVNGLVNNKVDSDNVTISSLPNSLLQSIRSKSKINGLKAVFVTKGTPLLAIATAADIAIATLLQYNDLQNTQQINDDQIIYLEPKNKFGNRDFYTSSEDEILYDISQSTAVQLKTLMQLNGMNDNIKITKGSKLKLR